MNLVQCDSVHLVLEVGHLEEIFIEKLNRLFSESTLCFPTLV